MKPPYEPSDKDRRVVEAMAAGGIAQGGYLPGHRRQRKDTAQIFPRHPRIRSAARHCGVIATLYRMATSGKDVAATIFWCKTRLKWKECPSNSPMNEPINLVVRSVLDPKPE